MKAIINTDMMKALALMTPKNAVRSCLNAIYVSDRHAVVAHDHYMVLVNVPEFEGEGYCYLLPEWVKGIKENSVTIETLDNGTIVNGVTYPKYDQGRYPDYRRVIPEKTSGDPAKYNLQYLSMFAKVEKLITIPGGLTIHQNGDSAAVITCDTREYFLGLLMPMRDGNNGPFDTPSWAFNREEAAR